jgi:hypothetical protein
MNNFMFTVLNADIPAIYVVVSVHIYVHCVIRVSVKRAALEHINAYIVVSAVMPVQCVIRHSIDRTV